MTDRPFLHLHFDSFVQENKSAPNANGSAGKENESNTHYRTLKKTRKFIVDGREVTTTSKKIVSGQDDDKKTAFAHQNRYKQLPILGHNFRLPL